MENNLLPGDYIAGFVDGEGCFYLTYRSETKLNRPGSPKYLRWIAYFAILLREDDREILEMMKNTLGCGNIYKMKNKQQTSLNIQNIHDLHDKVMPFFKLYPLRAKKLHDFKLWCQALVILYNNKINKLRCSDEQHKRLLGIRKEMRVYKSAFNKEYKNTPMFNQTLPLGTS